MKISKVGKESVTMKKIINNPADVVPEMVDGLVRSYPQYLRQLDGTTAMVRSDEASMAGKVGLVSGGGSGHEPAHAGFVGKGMLSAAVAGQVFTSPTPDQIYEAIKAADHGKGVFLIVKNYSGDVMNFDMAKDLADLDDIAVKSIVVDDDIAVEDSLYTQGRRGVAGTVLMHKILGAAADLGASLDEIEALAQKVLPNIKTIAVALSAATVPEAGKPGFTLADDEIEYGVGIHSEPGYRREKIKTSKALTEELLGKLDSEFHFASDKKYAMLVNGMGATPLMEQYIFSHDVLNALADRKITPVFTKVGNYMTSIDMAGLSLTFLELADDQWLDYLNYPVETIAW
jgi:dihydroxyacetone kinase-like protein